MYLVINTAREKVQAFGIYLFICNCVNVRINAVYKTILNKYISSKLFIFINYSCRFDQDRTHMAKIVFWSQKARKLGKSERKKDLRSFKNFQSLIFQIPINKPSILRTL